MGPHEFDALKTFVCNDLTGGAMDADTPLFSTRRINSRNLMHLVDFLERSFGIRFTPADMSFANLDTLNAMRAFVGRKRGKAAA
jgi:hypothetical protein